jgi:hypothetical protein
MTINPISPQQFEAGQLVFHLAEGTREPRPVTVVGHTVEGHPLFVEGHVSVKVTTDANLAVREDIPNHPLTKRRERILADVRWPDSILNK